MTKPVSSLKIVRHLKHDRTRVFSALTDPAKMSQWFFGSPGASAIVTNDLRVGGSYAIEMLDPQHKCKPHGIYLEIVPPEKLAFTWTSEPNVAETKVTIELFKDGAGTKLVITHQLPDDQVQPHREGWMTCFDHLEMFLDGRPAVAAATSAGPQSK